MPWTDAQREAIISRGQTLLVSAAAGSGKTAVLTERIVSLVKDGARIDDMLVVTFTKAAAAEMRARILSSLHDMAADNPHLAQQAMRVERADISTLHVFCGRVCRDYFQAAGVDPTFRVVDGAEANVMKDQALTEALTACYAEQTPAFACLADCVEQNMLLAITLRLYDFLRSRPDPWEWLAAAVAAHRVDEAALIESPWMNMIVEGIRAYAGLAASAYRQLSAFAGASGLFVDFTRNEAEMAEAFRLAAEGGYPALSKMETPKFKNKPPRRKEMDEEAHARYVALRDAAKDYLVKAGERLPLLAGAAGHAEDERDNALAFEGLAQAVHMFDERYAALKEERNLLDFSDMEHRALRALQQDEVSDAMRRRYAHVFVDEYQDSSLLQEALLSCVTRPDNLFMVGDVKQSIYRFRLAEPGLFMAKMAAFSPVRDALTRRIALSANFRSLPSVIDAVNGVFDRVFCGGAMELAYDDEARLVAGRGDSPQGAPAELHLIGGEVSDEEGDEEAATAAELSPQAKETMRQEAEIIADRIEALRAEDGGGYKLRDIAILMRTMRGKATQMVETLRMRGIAAWSDLGENALDRPEVQAVVALLRVVDNLRQDISLLAALRGPALGLDAEALASIRIAAPRGTMAEAMLAYAEGGQDSLAEALRAFVERIRGWALDAQVLPLDRLIRQICDETGHYAQSGARPDGALRQANLRMLAEHAGAYQRMNQRGLGGFLRYLERLRQHEGIEALDLGDRDDVVRVMSIHKSKGLQFPVVFVAGLGRRFGQQDARQPLQLHTSLGMAMQHVDPVLRTRRDTLSQHAIREQVRREAIAEEARVLYVAMTRAEARLIMVGTIAKGGEKRWDQMRSVESVPHAVSMLDWLVPVAKASACWQMTMHAPRETGQTAGYEGRAGELASHVRSLPQARASGAASALAWQPAAASSLPIKRSVSSIVREEAKRGEDEAARQPMLDAMPRRPLFMEEGGLTAAERGSAVHAFLSTVPLDVQDLDSACRNMVSRGLLSAEQASALPMDKLETLVRSPLWQRMRDAQVVRREWPFNLRVEGEGASGLLQGVIDCCFCEDGGWVLVDYKSDRADDVEALLDHYRVQVDIYAQALATISGVPVKERILYLLQRGQGYRL